MSASALDSYRSRHTAFTSVENVEFQFFYVRNGVPLRDLGSTRLLIARIATDCDHRTRRTGAGPSGGEYCLVSRVEK